MLAVGAQLHPHPISSPTNLISPTINTELMISALPPIQPDPNTSSLPKMQPQAVASSAKKLPCRPARPHFKIQMPQTQPLQFSVHVSENGGEIPVFD